MHGYDIQRLPESTDNTCPKCGSTERKKSAHTKPVRKKFWQIWLCSGCNNHYRSEEKK